MQNKCMDCDKPLKTKEAKRCSRCANIGENNPNYGKAHPLRGKSLSPETLAKMRAGHKKGEDSPLWKGGKPKCLDCGKELCNYGIKRCRPCSFIYRRKHPILGQRLSPDIIKQIGDKQRGRPRYDLRGENHYAWKGGISSLGSLIRGSIEGCEWRRQVFQRADYICSECGDKGCYLEAHHIKSFAEILEKYLKEYDQYSLPKDKMQLVRLASGYEPFWDIDNGMTLCKTCHKPYRGMREAIAEQTIMQFELTLQFKNEHVEEMALAD